MSETTVKQEAGCETVLRIVRVGRGSGRAPNRGRVYHGTYGCKALRTAAINPRATGRVPGYKELTQEQAAARRLKPCHYCHVSPAAADDASSRACADASADRAATVVEPLRWGFEDRRHLARAPGGLA